MVGVAPPSVATGGGAGRDPGYRASESARPCAAPLVGRNSVAPAKARVDRARARADRPKARVDRPKRALTERRVRPGYPATTRAPATHRGGRARRALARPRRGRLPMSCDHVCPRTRANEGQHASSAVAARGGLSPGEASSCSPTRCELRAGGVARHSTDSEPSPRQPEARPRDGRSVAAAAVGLRIAVHLVGSPQRGRRAALRSRSHDARRNGRRARRQLGPEVRADPHRQVVAALRAAGTAPR